MKDDPMIPLAIPGEISHLDFEPATQTEGEITPARECAIITILTFMKVFRRRVPCHQMAAGMITLRCCMVEFPCCAKHHRMPAPWLCSRCGHKRGDEWAVWRPIP